jgi:hypothetical protein
MIIGVAGTAKNTGKTTAICTLIRTACANGIVPGVTGIGYDGEERDTVTLLPKPRITVLPGMLVTTSEKCLGVSTAELRILRRTGTHTPLGEIVITRVDKEGLVVVAGPNKTADLEKVAGAMRTMGAEHLLVDGSLNRIAPMTVVDRVVFATGAARSTSLADLAEETASIEQVFAYEACNQDYRAVEGIRLVTSEVQVQCAASAFHSTMEIQNATMRFPPGPIEIVLPGMIVLDGLVALHKSLVREKVRDGRIVFDNPFWLLLAGEPVHAGRVLKAIASLGFEMCFRRTSRLAAVTFNPYYPAFDGTVYRAAYLDPSAGRAALAAALKTPLIDVLKDGGERLYSLCFESSD